MFFFYKHNNTQTLYASIRGSRESYLKSIHVLFLLYVRSFLTYLKNVIEKNI